MFDDASVAEGSFLCKVQSGRIGLLKSRLARSWNVKRIAAQNGDARESLLSHGLPRRWRLPAPPSGSVLHAQLEETAQPWQNMPQHVRDSPRLATRAGADAIDPFSDRIVRPWLGNRDEVGPEPVCRQAKS
jgi:hypothetical protein